MTAEPTVSPSTFANGTRRYQTIAKALGQRVPPFPWIPALKALLVFTVTDVAEAWDEVLAWA